MTGLVRVSEVYDRLTIQGEGPHAGRVCTFVRLWGCNLHCAWCDTPFTWDTKGRNGRVYPLTDNARMMTVDQVAHQVVETVGRGGLCVVSGGEPLVQYRQVLALADHLATAGVECHVETNGTIAPVDGPDHIGLYVVSPKLDHAAAGPVDRVLNSTVLHAWATLARSGRSVFKMVVRTEADVEDVVALYSAWQVPHRARWVMPEAITADDLADRFPAVAQWGADHGVNVTSRLHVAAWGTERGR